MPRMTVLIAFVIGVACLVPRARGDSVELPAAVGEKWIRVDTPHFTLLSMLDTDETVRIGTNLEYLRASLAPSSRGLDLQASSPTYVYVFDSEDAFAPYKTTDDGKVANMAGYCVPGANATYIAFNARDLDVSMPVVYHEYIHSMLHNSFSKLPLWLDEGLAEFFSTFVVSGTTAELGHPKAGYLLWLRSHPMLTLADLSAITTESPDYHEGEKQGTFYAESWLLTHYLVVGDREVDRAGKLLDLLGQGLSDLDALAVASGSPLPTLQETLEDYSRKYTLNFVVRHLQEALQAGGANSRAMETKETLYHLGDLLANHSRGQWAHAEDHLRAALAIDSTYAEPTCLLGYTAELRGDRTAARTHYERAIARDPELALAHSLLARSLLQEFLEGEPIRPRSLNTPSPILQSAQEHFRASLERNPDNILDCVGFGQTFLYDQGSLWEGIAALKGIWEAHPQRSDALMGLAILTAYASGGAPARRLADTYLRPMGATLEADAVEGAAIDADVAIAIQLAEDGRPDSALAVVREAAEATKNPELARHAHDTLRRFQGIAAKNADIERYNRANTLARGGAYDSAAVIFEQVSKSANDIMLRKRAAEASKEALFRGRYPEACRLTAKGRYREAMAVLQGLLNAELPDTFATQTRKAMSEVEQLSKGSR